ncbi:hypothetical protein BN961_01594 [Afipia felis]|uniref:Uncharacterized protein n=1 Tax=Afipia felis TaxID=1035 RepID=A0A090ML41_AFIFE|nr:hypothetical protein BN961_01594 [Afipia felis]
MNDVKGDAPRLARDLGPAREDVVDLGGREIRLDSKLAVVAADLATDLHGDRTGDAWAEIDPELGTCGIVERRREADVRIAIGILVIVDRGWLACDLHVALDAIALIVSDELERVSFQLLVHRELVDRNRAEIDIDGVFGVFLGQRCFQRHVQRDDRRDIALAGSGINHVPADVFQPVRLKNFSSRWHRPVEAEAYAGRRRLRHQIGDLEQNVGDRELASSRRIDAALTDRNLHRPAADMAFHVGVMDHGQLIQRMQLYTCRREIDRQALVRDRGAAARKGVDRRVHRDVEMLQGAATDALDQPFTHLRHDQDRPDVLQRRRRHRRRRKAELNLRRGHRVIDRARACDADLSIADIALGHDDPAMFGIEPQAHRDAVEDDRILSLGTGEHDRASGQSELPVRRASVRSLQMGERGDSIASRGDLERRNHDTPPGIPIKARLDLIDRHRIVRRGAVDDAALADGEDTAEISRQAVAADLALDLPAQQHAVGGVGEILEPRSQYQVFGRYLVGRQFDLPHAILRCANAKPERPGIHPFFTHGHHNAAGRGPSQAETDIVERKFRPALLVVHQKRAIAQADLVQALAVQSLGAERVEPAHHRKQSGRRRGDR